MRRIKVSVLQRMNSRSFEYFIADLWDRLGYDTRVTKQSNDAGIDVIATKETDEGSERVLIQAKRYGPSSKVSGPEIQQYAGLQLEHEDSTVVVVTSSGFTRPAHKRAKKTGVDVYSGLDVLKLVREVNAEDVVGKHSSSISLKTNIGSTGDDGAENADEGDIGNDDETEAGGDDDDGSREDDADEPESKSSPPHPTDDYETEENRGITIFSPGVIITAIVILWLWSLAAFDALNIGWIHLTGTFLFYTILFVWEKASKASRKLDFIDDASGDGNNDGKPVKVFAKIGCAGLFLTFLGVSGESSLIGAAFLTLLGMAPPTGLGLVWIGIRKAAHKFGYQDSAL